MLITADSESRTPWSSSKANRNLGILEEIKETDLCIQRKESKHHGTCCNDRHSLRSWNLKNKKDFRILEFQNPWTGFMKILKKNSKKCCSGDIGNWTPDLPHAKGALYPWAISPTKKRANNWSDMGREKDRHNGKRTNTPPCRKKYYAKGRKKFMRHSIAAAVVTQSPLFSSFPCFPQIFFRCRSRWDFFGADSEKVKKQILKQKLLFFRVFFEVLKPD